MTTAHVTTVQTEPSDPDRARRPSVVARVTRILDVFMQGEQFLMLEDITAATGLPRSTAFRMLSQLVDLHWLEHDSRGYRLGVRTAGLNQRGNQHDDLRTATAAALNDLHLATGGVAHLGVLNGATVHYLDKIGGSAGVTMPSRVGAHLPADRTVCGRALLATLPPERVDKLMSLGTARRGRAVDLPTLHAQLNKIRQRHGVAVDLGEQCELGITSMAAPIAGPDGAVGAISVASRDGLPPARVAPIVAFAARRASQLMFPDWPGARRRTPAGRAPRTRRA